MVGQTFRMARKDREMDRPQVEIPESTQASQPLQIYQAIRLVHHQEVRGILFFQYRTDYLHCHRIRLQ